MNTYKIGESEVTIEQSGRDLLVVAILPNSTHIELTIPQDAARKFVDDARPIAKVMRRVPGCRSIAEWVKGLCDAITQEIGE